MRFHSWGHTALVRLAAMAVALTLVAGCTTITGHPVAAQTDEVHTGLSLPDDLPESVPLIGGVVTRSESVGGDANPAGGSAAGSWVIAIDTGSHDQQDVVSRVRALLDRAEFSERQWRGATDAAASSAATASATPSVSPSAAPEPAAPESAASATEPTAPGSAQAGDYTDGETRVVVEVGDDGTVTYHVDSPDPGPADLDDLGGADSSPAGASAGDEPVGAPGDGQPTEPTRSTGPTAPGDPDQPAADDPAQQPSSSELIRRALAAGDIDEPTAFAYRVMAQFGDPALPDEFASDVPSHDPAAFVRWREHADQLPGDLRDKIGPYLQRPVLPGSAFTPAGGGEVTVEAPTLRASGTALHPHSNGIPHPADSAAASPRAADPRPSATAGERQQCTDGWTTGAVKDLPFRVWVCDNIDSGIALEALHYMLDLVETHAPAMMRTGSDGFGPPIPDDEFANDGIVTSAGDDVLDDKIDIYLLPRGWFGPERYTTTMLTRPGLTISAYPFDGVTSSAYVLLDSGLLSDPDRFEANLVHELAHVLQNAHHASLDASWISEATATWAMVHYLPKVAGLIHAKQLPVMQTSTESVSTESPTAHQYAAYLWLLMMEQETDASTIFQIWNRLEDAPDGAKTHTVLELIGTVFDMSGTFGEFAMRLLNAALPGDPITPRFIDHDPAFPDGQVASLPQRTLPDPGSALTIDHTGIPNLGYRYTQVTIPGPTNMAVWVKASGDLQGDDSHPPVAEALIRDTAGQYRRHVLDLSGDGFCAAGEIYLVVSNPTQFETDTTTGSVTLEPEDRACGLSGDLTITFSGRHDLQTMTFVERAAADWSGTLSLNLGEAVDNGSDPVYYPNLGSTWRGSGHYEFERCLGGAGQCTGDAIISSDFSADEPIVPEPNSMAHMAFPPDGEPYDDVQWTDMRLDDTEDGPVLSFTVSMRGPQTETFPGLGTATTDDGGFEWLISCGEMTRFWTDLGGHEIETLEMPESRDHPLIGDWASDHSAVTFDCTTNHDSGDGTTTSLSITGTLTQQ